MGDPDSIHVPPLSTTTSLEGISITWGVFSLPLQLSPYVSRPGSIGLQKKFPPSLGPWRRRCPSWPLADGRRTRLLF